MLTYLYIHATKSTSCQAYQAEVRLGIQYNTVRLYCPSREIHSAAVKHSKICAYKELPVTTVLYPVFGWTDGWKNTYKQLAQL